MLSINLKRLRELRGITQDELAEKTIVNGDSVSKTVISYYETGRSWPEFEYVKALAEALEVEESDLFFVPDFSRVPSDILLDMNSLPADEGYWAVIRLAVQSLKLHATEALKTKKAR